MRIRSDVAADITIRKGVAIEFSRVLEASIDCHVCRAARRTVVLYEDEEKSRCTPTGHAFPGVVEEIVASEPQYRFMSNRGVVRVIYRVTYEFETFSDTKRPCREIKPDISWGRISFKLVCPCGCIKEGSTQNNIVRPWTNVCKCGKPLMYEIEEMPRFTRHEPE